MSPRTGRKVTYMASLATYYNGPRAGKPLRPYLAPVGAWVQLAGDRRVGEVTACLGPYSLVLDDCLIVGESAVERLIPRPTGAVSFFEKYAPRESASPPPPETNQPTKRRTAVQLSLL